MLDHLLPEEVSRHLRTQWMGRDLRCFDEVDSTNRVARDAGRQGAPSGTVVTAEAQSRGRGRLGRDWVSPPHLNLYLSIVLRPGQDLEHLPWLSLVAGVAVCDAAREWDARATIKWPNDVLVARRKVAGILAEAEGEGPERPVVLGIGVNLNSVEEDFPPELRDKAASLRMTTGARVDRARFTACLLGHLEGRYEELSRAGFAPIRTAWWERSCLQGRRVTVQAPNGEVSGRALGLDENGALRLHVDDGGEQPVLAGDVTVLEWG